VLKQVVHKVNCCSWRDKVLERKKKTLTLAAGREGELLVYVTAISIWDEPLLQDVTSPAHKTRCDLQTNIYIALVCKMEIALGVSVSI
jgi:hypothetical protein